MESHAKILDSLAKFKKFLNEKYERGEKFFDYNSFYGPYSKIITQMRLGLSSLHSHLFAYNISDKPFCSNCIVKTEDICHFFFKCPCYSSERSILLDKLKLFVPDYSGISITDLSDICLNGIDGLDYESNYNILLATGEFIMKSKRFNDMR